jgi:WXXGXW repeat (2 copies)
VHGKSALSVAALAVVLALPACEHAAFTFYSGVGFGPPAPRFVGPVGMAPGPGFVWTDGFYDWSGNNWAWRPGRWQRPPRPGMRWEMPRYQRHDGGYRMYPGRWR